MKNIFILIGLLIALSVNAQFDTIRAREVVINGSRTLTEADTSEFSFEESIGMTVWGDEILRGKGYDGLNNMSASNTATIVSIPPLVVWGGTRASFGIIKNRIFLTPMATYKEDSVRYISIDIVTAGTGNVYDNVNGVALYEDSDRDGTWTKLAEYTHDGSLWNTTGAVTFDLGEHVAIPKDRVGCAVLINMSTTAQEVGLRSTYTSYTAPNDILGIGPVSYHKTYSNSFPATVVFTISGYGATPLFVLKKDRP